MAALKTTTDATARAEPQPKASSVRIEMATAASTPVESGAHRLRFHLEAAFAQSPPGASLAEPDIGKWPRPVRAAILAGAVVLPWSLIFLTVNALGLLRRL